MQCYAIFYMLIKIPTSSPKLLTLIDETQQQEKYYVKAAFSWHFL